MNINTIVSISGQIIMLFTALTSLFIALFGESVKAKIQRPKLIISVKNRKGVQTYDSSSQSPVRFYHLNVSNVGKIVAHNSYVALKKVSEESNGVMRDLWEGTVSLNWMNVRNEEKETRDIGATSYDCDFVCIFPNALKFALVMVPNNFHNQYNEPVNLKVVLQVLSDEAQSDEVIVNVNWDGKWDSGETEMGRHCVVEMVNEHAKIK